MVTDLDYCLFLREKKRMLVMFSWKAASGYEEVERILGNESECSLLRSLFLREPLFFVGPSWLVAWLNCLFED